jgi:uncharacterized protein (TIGR02646 family)
MIQVYKSMVPPPALAAADAAHAALAAEYDRLGAAACQQSGNRLLNVPATLYNAATVKDQLIADQHGKCCYCEAYLRHVGYGDVEHYRPKNGFKQDKADRQLGKPGYYWVAFDWDNLLFVCERCNRGHKRNYFPLRDPARRARSHHQPLRAEAPLLLHPAFHNPAGHIEFRKEVAVGQTDEGRETIRFCGLNRPKTREHRRAHLGKLMRDELLADLNIAALNDAEKARLVRKYGNEQALVRRIIQARKACREATAATAEYAGMARSYFQ